MRPLLDCRAREIDTMPDKTAQKQKATMFRPGKSGNPAGRPKGSRNKTTMAVQALLDGDAEALSRVAIEKALSGDMTALRLCLERICPAPKDRPLEDDAIKLPSLKTGILMEISAKILQAVASGKITPNEGQALAGLLESHRRIVEITNLEKRVAELEAQNE